MIYLIQQFYSILRGSFFHPQWLSDRWHRMSRQQLKQINNSFVLDIGSGNSNNIEWLGTDNYILRLDYPDTNQRYQRLPEVFGDACHLPFAEQSIDVVLLLEVLEHIADADTALSEVHRVLQNNGTLLISVPFIYPIHDAPYDYRRFTRYGLKQILEQHGFDILSEISHGNSFSVSIQLFNLALLETTQKNFNHSTALGITSATIFYPLLLINNIFGYALSFLPVSSSTFGYFVVARCKKN